MQTSMLDNLTRSLTAWSSFDDMINESGNYRPSLYVKSCNRSKAEKSRAELTKILADAYDAAQTARGDSRRAYRG